MIDDQKLKEALELIDHGLSYRMSQSAREFAEDSLWLFRNDRFESGVDSLCNAIGLCQDPVALKHLVEAREILAPDRIASS